MSLGLRFLLTDDQQELAAGVRSALAEICPPEVVRASWAGPVDELEAALADLALYDIAVPEELDGLGLGASDMVGIFEELGRACVPGPVVDGMVLAPLLEAAGLGELRQSLADGDAQVAVFRAGEPCAHAAQANTLFRWSPAQVELVESSECTPLTSVDGARRLAQVRGAGRAVELDPALVHDHLVLATSAQLIGLARHMLDVTVAYAKVREQFGSPIGAQQAIQHHLANALLALRFAVPVVHQAAWSVHHATPLRGLHVAMAKVKAAEAAETVARIALQVHGAIAYTTEYDLHLWMKRTWALSRAWGGVREHLDTIAVSLLDEPSRAPLDGIDLGTPNA